MGSAETARSLAIAALVRIEAGAFANLVLPAMLGTSQLDRRDRAFATELVYGTTRMRRACDFLVDQFLTRSVEPELRAALRLGAYQLAFAGVPPHAAVAATVGAAPARGRGLVNAVLRKVAAAWTEVEWPGDASRLSYPDWLVDSLVADLGRDRALAALEAMNAAGRVTERADGYVQDLASQWVAAYLGTEPGDVVMDVCAGPGGKATFAAAAGAALVVAGDSQQHRAGLVAGNARRLGYGNVAVVVADARRPAHRPATADRVLVDAPCTGLGVLHRRPDARWRVRPDDAAELASLQREILGAAARLVRPGGVLVYSVCTLLAAETVAIDDWLAAAHPDLGALPPPDGLWEAVGRGARLLPQAAGTDGMYVLGLCRS